MALPLPKNSAGSADTAAARVRLRDIIHARSFGYADVTLASGRKSNFYFNLKPTMLHPEGAALLAELTLDALRDIECDYVGGLEMGAVPIAGAIAQASFQHGRPISAFFVRKKPKEHGAKLHVEGLTADESLRGKRVVVVEDVTTTGGSALKAIEAVGCGRQHRAGVHHRRPRGGRGGNICGGGAAVSRTVSSSRVPE